MEATPAGPKAFTVPPSTYVTTGGDFIADEPIDMCERRLANPDDVGTWMDRPFVRTETELGGGRREITYSPIWDDEGTDRETTFARWVRETEGKPCYVIIDMVVNENLRAAERLGLPMDVSAIAHNPPPGVRDRRPRSFQDILRVFYDLGVQWAGEMFIATGRGYGVRFTFEHGWADVEAAMEALEEQHRIPFEDF